MLLTSLALPLVSTIPTDVRNDLSQARKEIFRIACEDS
jgi:hypothetical protein